VVGGPIGKSELETMSNNNVFADVRSVTIDVSALSGDTPKKVVWDGSKFEAVDDVPMQPVQLTQFPFSYDGKAKDKWLSAYGAGNESSDAVPVLIPFEMTIDRLSYINEDDDEDTDVRIYVNGSAVRNIRMQNVRSGVFTFSPINLDIGDKVGVFLRELDKGKPKNPTVTLWATVSST